MNNIEDDSRNWKWQIFYFNRSDSRIFVPKRTGLGWTINIAHPISVVIPIALCLLAVLLRKIF
jgi:uncharacterized membrane protein